jgi:hypothetical protein
MEFACEDDGEQFNLRNIWTAPPIPEAREGQRLPVGASNISGLLNFLASHDCRLPFIESARWHDAAAIAEGIPKGRLKLPTRTPIGVIVDRFMQHLSATCRPKSAQTDSYRLREFFGDLGGLVGVTGGPTQAQSA